MNCQCKPCKDHGPHHAACAVHQERPKACTCGQVRRHLFKQYGAIPDSKELELRG